MPRAVSPPDATDTSLRQQVYASLREALTMGRFAPGQKVTFRYIAGVLGVSLTPVREALRRLVAEGAFEMNPNRSVRVPLMTRDKVLELRDIRIELEGLASAKAAMAATRNQIAGIRRAAREIIVARNRGDGATDRQKVREYHFAVYAAAGQPTLLRLIESLWLQTGPYMNLLYPDFISSSRGPAGRQRLIEALQARNPSAARREMANDIRRALSYVADLADDNGNIAPAAPTTVTRRRRQPAGAASFALHAN
ncbi:GntR family transcriptional regulator [Reyranella sp.]|uniref:GntR family transcriptional regulator n=1 Tax=Reyranella sp. TaxID=1929291 RepID=UPI003F703669